MTGHWQHTAQAFKACGLHNDSANHGQTNAEIAWMQSSCSSSKGSLHAPNLLQRCHAVQSEPFISASGLIRNHRNSFISLDIIYAKLRHQSLQQVYSSCVQFIVLDSPTLQRIGSQEIEYLSVLWKAGHLDAKKEMVIRSASFNRGSRHARNWDFWRTRAWHVLLATMAVAMAGLLCIHCSCPNAPPLNNVATPFLVLNSITPCKTTTNCCCSSPIVLKICVRK